MIWSLVEFLCYLISFDIKMMLTSYNDGEVLIFFLCSGPMGVTFSLRTGKKFPMEFSILGLFLNQIML